MIFSRGLLRLLRSQLSYCVRHMFSPHEDIEIGRCVWKYVKDVVIPKAWETKELFYQQYDKVSMFIYGKKSENEPIVIICTSLIEAILYQLFFANAVGPSY